MKLLTAEIRKKLPKLYSQEKKDPKEVPIVVKFFSPYSGWTWYVTEGEEVELEDGTKDWQLFGLVRGFETEMGYFMLSELENARGMGGRLPLVERDMYFGEHTLAEAKAEQI